MILFKVHINFLTVATLIILIAISALPKSHTKRVIFYSRPHVFTGQLFATSAITEPCPKCQIRDHRGRCRRTVSFKQGSKC